MKIKMFFHSFLALSLLLGTLASHSLMADEYDISTSELENADDSAQAAIRDLSEENNDYHIIDLNKGSIIVAAPDELYQAEKKQREDGYVINFDNVGIIEYLRWISNITNTNFIFNEEDLQFNITIISKEQASVEVIMATLLQILRNNGLALLEQGSNIVIYKSGQTGTSSIVSEHNLSQMDKSSIVTRVFQLKNVNPSRLARIIQPLLSQSALVETSDETRHLIVTDITFNIAKVDELLRTLDKPNLSLDIGMYTVKHLNIASLVNLAQRIVAPLADDNLLLLVPQPNSGTIFIVSTPYLIEKTGAVLATLDNPRAEGSVGISAGAEDSGTGYHTSEDLPEGHIDRTDFHVYKVQYHQGNAIQKSLKKIGNTLAKTGVTNRGLVTAINTIEWIEATNSLVFSGDGRSIKKLKDLIGSLDIPTREVFIEVLVIETSVTNSLTFGVDVATQSSGLSSKALATGFQGAAGNLPGAISTLAGVPDASSLLQAKGFSLGVIGKILQHGPNSFTSLGALVKAVHADTDTSIVMNPQIVTENGHPAELFVGSTNRFASTEISSGIGGGTTTNFEYRRIGARLRVTPTLGNSDIVTLDIEQNIDTTISQENGGNGGGNNNTPSVFDTKSTRTRVHVPDQYFLILSGMISEDRTKTKQRLPCLGGVPFLGAAMSNQTTTAGKKNLMLFIRPHIISTPDELKRLTEQQKARLPAESKDRGLDFEVDGLLEFLELKGD